MACFQALNPLVLREDQLRDAEHLAQIFPKQRAVVNGSDMGVGKTVTAIEVMKRFNLPTLVVCPRAVVPNWERTALRQGTDISAIGIERLRTGNTPYGTWENGDIRDGRFRFNENIKMLFFDEAHRFGGYDTLNSAMLEAARDQRIPAMLLSATLAEDPLDLSSIGYVLGLHEGYRPRPTLRNPDPISFYQWAKKHGCGKLPYEYDFRFLGNEEQRLGVMAKIHAQLFPAKGVRTTIAELGDAFPKTQITAELYDISDPGRAESLYARMEAALEKLSERTAEYSNAAHSALMAERQEVELLKVPIFIELAESSLRSGASVVFFVNFRATLDELCYHFGTKCRIDGSQVGAKGEQEREHWRQRFQDDKERVCGVISDAGGAGLDLDDIHGNHPRHTYVSLGFNAKLTRQLFGRVCRASTLTPSLQRIVLLKGTCEEDVFSNVTGKLNCLDALNDGDLLPRRLTKRHVFLN